MQKISLSMITILLFVQILSNGFAQLPTVVDDEILEEDVEIPSLTSARNNTSCGSNSSLTDLWASTDSSTWGTWSNGVYGYYDVNCTVIGNNYTLEATISNSAGGWSSYSFWNWSETNSHEYMSEAWTNLTAGTYCVNATLWDVSSGTSNYVDSDYPCFTLTNSSGSGNNTGGNNTGGNNTGGNNTGGNNTGGNNTGGNNTGGNNSNQMTYNAYQLQYCFSTAEDIEIFMNINGLNATEFYLEWEITSGSTIVASGSPLISVNSNGTVSYTWTFNSSALNTGVYTVMLNPADSGLSNLFSNSPFYYNIEVGCNNTGGNNTGGNNTGGNNTGGNNNTANNDSHCLTVGNFAISSTYFVTIDLINTCSFDINYPGINASADDSGVSGFYNQTSWWYMIGANGTYNLSVQLIFDSSVQNGTNITLDFEAVILNCGINGAWHDCPNSTNSTLSYQFQYTPPSVSLIIYSANLNSDNDRISVVYSSQNYTGYVNWEYNSSNGTSTSSSYTNSYTRTTYIYPNTFGTIQICGTIDNSVTECVSVNRASRIVEGWLISPNNNTSQNGAYISISYIANNYSNGMITLNGVNYNSVGSSFGENNSGNGSGNSNAWNVSGNIGIYIPYGMSTICLELEGEDGTEISDCIVVNRIIPTHSVTISYPNSNTSFTGENISLTYLLENSSMHYFTVDGVTTYASNSSWSSNQIQILIGFGTHSICVVSADYASQLDWDCITVTMLNPNADFDSDGVVDLSDLCPHTPTTESANSDGCSTSQLDSDSDGVADNVDICPATQQFSTVNSVGCSALQRDSDGDGVMDNLDVCPSSPANSIVDAYGCSNTQTDSDNDGVVDSSDMCPNTIVGSQVNANGCASSQLDSDSDGIVDSFDLCSNTSIGTVVDQTGCPYSTSGNSSGNNNGSTSGGSGSSGGSSGGGGLPSIGVVGTIAAIAIGFIFTTRREDEE